MYAAPDPQICRTLPWVIQTYKLEELTTLSDLRHNINQMFRKYSEVKSPEAVDLLIYKGREELEVREGGVFCVRVCGYLGGNGSDEQGASPFGEPLLCQGTRPVVWTHVDPN